VDLLDAALILAAGTAAGTINAAVGSGSLITFPTLLALGIPPVTANVSNNIGLVPGGLASVWGYRRELADQRRRLVVLGSMSVLGGVVGSALLLVLPESAFGEVVPVLIGVAIVLVGLQPSIQRTLAGRRAGRTASQGRGSPAADSAAATADIGPGAMAATERGPDPRPAPDPAKPYRPPSPDAVVPSMSEQPHRHRAVCHCEHSDGHSRIPQGSYPTHARARWGRRSGKPGAAPAGCRAVREIAQAVGTRLAAKRCSVGQRTS